jgi:hypothetical protein
MDKIIIIIIGIIILAAIGFWAWQSGFIAKIEPTQLPEEIVLFYGQGCSHCRDVENFLTQNNIEEKVKFTKLEVWFNKSNAMLLGQVAVKCGKGTSNGVPVPFLYSPPDSEAGEVKCLVGSEDIINFFKSAVNI